MCGAGSTGRRDDVLPDGGLVSVRRFLSGGLCAELILLVSNVSLPLDLAVVAPIDDRFSRRCHAGGLSTMFFSLVLGCGSWWLRFGAYFRFGGFFRSERAALQRSCKRLDRVLSSASAFVPERVLLRCLFCCERPYNSLIKSDQRAPFTACWSSTPLRAPSGCLSKDRCTDLRLNLPNR